MRSTGLGIVAPVTLVFPFMEEKLYIASSLLTRVQGEDTAACQDRA